MIEGFGWLVARDTELITAHVIQAVAGDRAEIKVVIVFETALESPHPGFQWMADVAAQAE